MARGSKRGHDKWTRRHDASDADLTVPQGDPLADEMRGQPFDLGAVQRDDALLDALAGGGDVPTSTEEEYRLAALLAGWRAEIVGPDLPAGPTLDEAAAAVDRERGDQQAPRRGLRLLRPIAGAAAAIAVVMAGVTVFSYNAQPGDPLWRVKEVVFTQRANSTVASIDTTNNLEEAERMIKSGNPQGAIAVLESASKRVGDVSDTDKRDELNAWHDRLMADMGKTTTTTAPPGTTTSVPGATTTLPAVPPTSLPGSAVTTKPSVPPEILIAPEVPSQPPVTTAPPITTVPPVTTVPEPTVVEPAPTTASSTSSRVVTPMTATIETRPLTPDTSPSG
ncbi:anti-sigma-D factor RsdA [Rhodococcus sp. NPDC058505]|uniref:anti-sigma-D factor RsdA n=1 Tax=unclassified Rhodococcus (in: high G+C Gram-positive bacteria) TaxID=192944 RepID=UPI0036607003